MRYAVACVLLVLCGACLAADTQPATKPKPTWFDNVVAKIPEKLLVKEADSRDEASLKQRAMTQWWKEACVSKNAVITGKVESVRLTGLADKRRTVFEVRGTKSTRGDCSFSLLVSVHLPESQFEKMKEFEGKNIKAEGESVWNNQSISTPKRFMYSMGLWMKSPKVTVVEEDRAAAR